MWTHLYYTVIDSLVFYAQSTSMVISGQYTERKKHVLHCGCGITHTFSRCISFSYLLYIMGVTTPTLFWDSCEKRIYVPNSYLCPPWQGKNSNLHMNEWSHRKSRWNRKVHTAWISIKKKLCKLMAETPPPALVGLFYDPRSKQLEFFGPHFTRAIMTKELRSNFVCLASLTLSNFVQMGFSQLISCQTLAFSRCTFIYI